ncbi:hypothetical protein Tco_0337928, partial [Tanacetum coccineum]
DEVGSPSGSHTSETETDDNQSQKKELSKSEERDADKLINEITELNASTDKPSDPIGLLQSEITSLSLYQTMKETMPSLLADALKDTLLSLFHEFVKNIVHENMGEQTSLFQAQVH